jgi:hypothetical protein
MSWYVLSCKPTHTLDIVGVLNLHHIRAWTPWAKDTVSRPDRNPDVIRPLLPGYIFIEAEHLAYAEQVRDKKLTTPFEKLKIDNRTLILRDDEIHHLKIRPGLSLGQSACIAAGPGKGLCGTVEDADQLGILLNVHGELKYIPPFLLDAV